MAFIRLPALSDIYPSKARADIPDSGRCGQLGPFGDCGKDKSRGTAVGARRPAASEIPRTDQFETCRFEVREVPGRQAPAVDARNGGDHSVGGDHGSALSERCTHDVAAGERGAFREGEDPVGKTVAPGGQPCSKRATLWSGRRRRMPARAPPREFHKLRARVPRYRRSIDVRGAPGREPSRYALKAGVRPCWKSCPSATPNPFSIKKGKPAPDGNVASGDMLSSTTDAYPAGSGKFVTRDRCRQAAQSARGSLWPGSAPAGRDDPPRLRSGLTALPFPSK
jgi:hypothetical protein